MAKKDKSNSSNRPQANAPELRHMLHSQQPAHNPYYPDPASIFLTPTSIPPPPYSQTSVSASATTAARNSVPMSHTNDISYPRIQSGTTPIVIQAPGVPYDYRADRHRRKVRSFTSQTIVIAVFSIMLALWAYSLYNDRACIYQFVVHKVNQDLEIKISDVRQSHLHIAYASGVLIIICLLKQAIGFRGKNHSCFLFIVGLFTLIMCMHNAYFVYLAYYSPCVATVGELSSNTFKTIVSKFADSLPTPDKGIFGESNVIAEARRDGNGLVIFIVDVLNVIFYLSIFISSTTLF